MPHAFDGHGFGQVLGEAERLFAGAQEHHLRLAEVVTRLAGGGAHAPAGETFDRGAMTALRQLLTAAEEQQHLAGTVLTHLIGARAAIEAPRRQRLRVLIVDDSDGSRETAAAILEEAGFETLTASNGLEGLIVAHYALPVVVLMDLTMPVLSGLEAARLLRASLLTRHLKVIAFTAMPDIYEESVGRFFADILMKPAAPETIITTVQRCVGSDRLTDVGSEEGPAA
jgi:CheY-like chemotaxis protein